MLAKNIAIKLIRIYQKTVSPDHGWFSKNREFGYCKFYPSCSEYTNQAIKKYGLAGGAYRGMKRIVKCNPLSKGGLDPLK